MTVSTVALRSRTGQPERGPEEGVQGYIPFLFGEAGSISVCAGEKAEVSQLILNGKHVMRC